MVVRLEHEDEAILGLWSWAEHDEIWKRIDGPLGKNATASKKLSRKDMVL